jgi:signal transduction histidine kinase
VTDDRRLVLAVDAYRVAALGYAVVVYTVAQDEYRHPGYAWLVLAVLAVWTAAMLVAPRPRPAAVLVFELVLAVAGLVGTRWLAEPFRIEEGAATLPTIWAAAPVLAWALRWNWRGGLAAASVVAVADYVESGNSPARVTPVLINNIVLIVLAGLIVGFAAQLVREGRARLAEAVAVRAAAAERERLARDIHDSVLQVLGFVHRRGAGQAGEAGELARMAGEQEARLRAMISSGPGASPAGSADLRHELLRFAGGRVTVSAPAGPVVLGAAAVSALVAATGAALDNVARHAGPDAKAWVLLEDEPDAVTLTVRDDGAGFGPARLEQARAQGRLGVSTSIRGRVEEVGGTVDVIAAPGRGTEIEMRVPR